MRVNRHSGSYGKGSWLGKRLFLEKLEPRILLNGSTMEIELFRGEGTGYPVEGDEEYDYEISVGAEGLTDLEVTTPWDESFTASDYLPVDWSGEYYENEVDALDLWLEAYTEDGIRWIEVEWEISESEFNVLDSEPSNLTVTYDGGSWSGAVDFSSSPMPTQVPEITYPSHEDTGVELQPTFTWEEWASPDDSANPGVWWELEEVDVWDEIYEEDAPADTTSWTPTADLDAWTEYEFDVDFYHSPTVMVNDVDVSVVSWLESRVRFTTTGGFNRVELARGNDTGYPVEGDEGYEYYVEVGFYELTDLEVITPWGESFTASEYLPDGWSGEYYENEVDALDLWLEAYTEDGIRCIEVEWEIPESEFNDLDSGTSDLTVTYDGGSWSGTVDFYWAPMPTQVPEITYPSDGATGVDLQPTITWEQWANPNTMASPGVWWELEEVNSGNEIYEEDDAPADTTGWMPAAALDAGTEYDFAVDFHHSQLLQVNGGLVIVASYLESGVRFTTSNDWSPMEIELVRGNDTGYPVEGDEEYDYEISVGGDGITDLVVTTPWGELFTASEYLPDGWSGEYYENEVDALDLWLEAYTEDGIRWIEVEWEISESEFSVLDSGISNLTVTAGGGSWSGAVDFSSSPMPTQVPEITYPSNGATGVDLQPTITWGQWANPVTTANPGVWWELEEVNSGNEIYEEDHAPADTTGWTPAAALDAGTEYDFAVDFHHSQTEAVNDVSIIVGSYLESDVRFTTSNATPAVWGVTEDDRIYFRQGVTGTEPGGTGWQLVDGRLNQVSVGENGLVWGVTEDDRIYRRTGISPDNPIGDGWERVDGLLDKIAVGDGEVWGVTDSDRIYRRTGEVNAASNGSGWERISGFLSEISVGKNSDGNAEVWGVTDGDRIYRRTGIDNSDPNGSGWERIPGMLNTITVGDGSIWGITSGGSTYYRTGISGTDHDGDGWQRVGGVLESSATWGHSYWGVTSVGNIYYRTGISDADDDGDGWMKVPGYLRRVAVGEV